MQKIKLFFFIALITLLFSQCTEPLTGAFDLNSNTPVFNLDKFEGNLLEAVGNQPVGWGYTIGQNGQLARSGASGFARAEADGALAFSIDKKINMASISKFLTAIAALQLLEKRNLSLDAKIAPWLPLNWQKDDGVSELTFRDLLTHTSGLQSQNSNFSQTLCYNCLRQTIATGVVNPKTRQYLNANFALFRILIPSLWKGLNDAPSILFLNDVTTQKVYLQYMQKHVFSPIGIQRALCSPENKSISTLYYNVNDPDANQSGVFYGDWRAISGGGGYFLTTRELGQVLAYYQHTEVLLSKQQKQEMKEARIGFEREDESREKHGKYYGKNGSISNGANQGVLTQLVLFPNNIEIAVTMNSQGQSFPGGANIRQMIYKAYNDAWEKP